MKLPWMKWLTSVWRSDPQISRLTPATRGIWKDFLDAMHELDQCGLIAGTREELARIGRCTLVELNQAIDELSTSQTADVTERDSIVTLVNRRMRREWAKRKAAAERQKRFRDRDLPLDDLESNAPVTPKTLEERDVDKDLKHPAERKPGKASNSFADAFKAAFDAVFPEKYAWGKGDFVQLAKWRETYPDVTPERFVEVARFQWERGQYRPTGSLTIAGVCTRWAQFAAGASDVKPAKAKPTETPEQRRARRQAADAEVS